MRQLWPDFIDEIITPRIWIPSSIDTAADYCGKGFKIFKNSLKQYHP